jgi:ATP-dependent helicase HrpB
VTFDPAVRGVRARRVTRLGHLVLGDAPLERPDPDRVQAALLEGVTSQGLDVLVWPEEAVQLRARVALMRTLQGAQWPELSDPALLATTQDWLAPALDGVMRLDTLDDGALVQALYALLPFDLRRRLDAEAPQRFRTPAGADHRIDYAVENGPALDVRLQELFGMATHPAVAGGRAPLLLRLLSPAGRPVQTTRDLPGFWRGSYAAVKSEMKGRYPRHPWPDDPLAAPPTRRAKPRGS